MFDSSELKSDICSVGAIVAVVSAVFVLLSERLDRTEYGTMIAVASCLVIFEIGRYTDRYNRRKTEPRRLVGCWSVGRMRVLVAFAAATLMMVLYSSRFDFDEWLRIGVMASVFGGYEALRILRLRWPELASEQGSVFNAGFSALRVAFAESLGTVLGTALGAGIIGGIGWLTKPVVVRLLLD